VDSIDFDAALGVHRNSFVDERFANTLSALTESAKVLLAGGHSQHAGRAETKAQEVRGPRSRADARPAAAGSLRAVPGLRGRPDGSLRGGLCSVPAQSSAAHKSLLFPEHGGVGSPEPSRRSSVGSVTYVSAPSSHHTSISAPCRGEGSDMLSPFVSPREHGRREANRRYSVQAGGAAGEPFDPALVAHALNKVKLEAGQGGGHHPHHADDVLLFSAPDSGVGHPGPYCGPYSSPAGAGAARWLCLSPSTVPRPRHLTPRCLFRVCGAARCPINRPASSCDEAAIWADVASVSGGTVLV
jgi:hypothetical protein